MLPFIFLIQYPHATWSACFLVNFWALFCLILSTEHSKSSWTSVSSGICNFSQVREIMQHLANQNSSVDPFVNFFYHSPILFQGRVYMAKKGPKIFLVGKFNNFAFQLHNQIISLLVNPYIFYFCSVINDPFFFFFCFFSSNNIGISKHFLFKKN